MGKVFKPDDVAKGRKWIFEEALRDLTPGVRESTKNILESWKGKESEDKLIELLGDNKARRILKKISLYKV